MQRSQPILDLPEAARAHLRVYLAARSRPDPSGCIIWTGRLDHNGYGKATLRGLNRTTGAHRAAWLAERGRIPDASLVIDHLCRNRACVNPDHLEPVTSRENTLRGDLESRRNPRPRRGPKYPNRTTCAQGHPWAENVLEYVDKTGHHRLNCKACRAEWQRRRRARKAAALAA